MASPDDQETHPPKPPSTAKTEKEDLLSLLHTTDFTDPVERWEESIGAAPIHERSSHWSVAWADLTMTMFILFTVMYIYQSASRQFLGGDDPTSGFTAVLGSALVGVVSEGSGEPSAKLYNISKQLLEGDIDAAKVDLAVDQSVRIVLTGDLLFTTGQAELKPAAREVMVKVAQIIKKTPYMVNVVGHTDSVPIHSSKYPTNWELSLARASQVARFFTEQMGIPGKRFYVTGHSYHRPLLANTTPANRRINRRVEVIITKEMPEGYSLPDPGIKPVPPQAPQIPPAVK